jgi:hypothetical protein
MQDDDARPPGISSHWTDPNIKLTPVPLWEWIESLPDPEPFKLADWQRDLLAITYGAWIAEEEHAAKLMRRRHLRPVEPNIATDWAAEVARLRAGEDLTPPEEGAVLTPGQLLARLNAATPEQRLELAAAMLDNAATVRHCLMADHDGLYTELTWVNGERFRLQAILGLRRPPRLAINGRAYRRRTRGRTRSRR